MHPYLSNQRYERLIISLNSKQLQARGLYIFVHIIYIPNWQDIASRCISHTHARVCRN